MASRRPTKRSQWGGQARWPAPSVPIAVEGGLQARSQRGRIGDTWWSQRFIAVLESFGMGGRLQRGKRYARSGQVLHMDISPGRVSASVQGSRTKPYRVFIETGIISAGGWDAAESVMATSAVFLAKLLAGEMPEEIEEAFTDASGSLFPASPEELDSACSCPDWENPCKHIAAVYFLLAEAFDRDPFLIFAWRGKDKAELLDNLRARRHGARSDPGSVPEETPAAEVPGDGQFGWPTADRGSRELASSGTPESFWGRHDDVSAIEVRPRLAVASDLVLRQLDPSPLGTDGTRIIDALRPMYEAITAGAADEALGDPMSVPISKAPNQPSDP